ncbi:MAG: hypothetical protein KF833_18970 [Verrucomicrobiae bacterium]|nr:hypothetical protein [Verrucomicrobiae bacterium]
MPPKPKAVSARKVAAPKAVKAVPSPKKAVAIPETAAAKPRKAAVKSRTIATKAKKVAPKVTAQRIDKTGLTSRIRGHVSARGRRAQAARNKR